MSGADESPRARAIPRSFWLAVALWALFGALHALGLRDWVSVLSGTPVAGVAWEIAAMGGAAYVLAWFGAVLVAPILALAAAIGTAFERARA